MVHTLDRPVRSILIGLGFVLGAIVFFLAGLGTGLSIASPASAADTSTMIELLYSPTPEAAPTLFEQPSVEESDSFVIFWEAWRILQSEFYGELPSESELPHAAIRGVIAATDDQYTAFLDPERAEILRTDLSGSFEGIGATVSLRTDGTLEIVQPLAGQPAMQAGLRANDTILAVDGIDLQGMTLYEAISLIRGPAGTTVELLVERQDIVEPFIVLVVRARIEMPVVESEMLEQGIGYIRLTEYGQTSTIKLKEALRDLDAQGAQALVFDLRGNRGGYLSTAIEITSQFIDEGLIVSERLKDGRERQHNAIAGGLALDIPLVVLVDGASASASEITAGAIQDTERGVLIGTNTLGKGSVQVTHNLMDGSELRVTIARWFTPNGRGIHGEGLEPDITVEITEDDLTEERDPQLERALEYLLEGK